MFRNKLLYILAPLTLMASTGAAAAATVNVTKSATCECCSGWVEHMKKAGFTVKVNVVDDVAPTKRRLGVPAALSSCHTSEVGGYVIEGHVPAADVRTLLAKRPKATGIAVPGMVVGSPGMEEGGRRQPYQTLLFDKTGTTKVFASH